MSDKGPGQQVDVPQQLLLFMALHTEKSVGQNSTLFQVCHSGSIKFNPVVSNLGKRGKMIKCTETGSYLCGPY